MWIWLHCQVVLICILEGVTDLNAYCLSVYSRCYVRYRGFEFIDTKAAAFHWIGMSGNSSRSHVFLKRDQENILAYLRTYVGWLLNSTWVDNIPTLPDCHSVGYNHNFATRLHLKLKYSNLMNVKTVKLLCKATMYRTLSLSDSDRDDPGKNLVKVFIRIRISEELGW